MPSGPSKRIKDALEKEQQLEPMRVAFRSVTDKQDANAARIPDLSTDRERLRRVREACVGDADLLETAIANLKENGFLVRRVRDAAEAVAAVLEEMGEEELLVKSKSNLSKEIRLTPLLEAAGKQVVETDIGDRIIQLSGETTVHPAGPCAQLTRYRIAEILSEHLVREIEPEPVKLIEAILGDLAPYFEKARVGLTGVNAVAVEEGALMMIHNEGNLDLVSQVPGKLIVLASPEKLYPDLEEAVNMVKLETYYATGQPMTSFIRVIGGPSRTADIEKELYRGVHGPREIVILMIDNGRTALMDDEDLRESLYCVGCGSCLLECPVYQLVGPAYGAPGHLGGIGVCQDSAIGDLSHAIDEGLSYCTTCRNCVERCPASIDIPRMVERLRARATEIELLPLPEHQPLVASVRNYMNPWMQPRNNRSSWAKDLGIDSSRRSQSIFFAGCSLSFVSQEVAVAAFKLLEALSVNPVYLGKEERCCGSPVLRLGEEKLFLKLAGENIEWFDLPGVGEIVTTCPGCLKALREYRDYFPEFKLRIRHISEVLAEAVEEGRIELKAPAEKLVTYHDPCHLGRGCGIYEEPRRVLAAVEGLSVVEMRKNCEYSGCCGAGGGVKTAFPELAQAIGGDRCGMAEEIAAEQIITCCPWCEQNLADSMAGNSYRVPVRDLVEVVTECLVPTGE